MLLRDAFRSLRATPVVSTVCILSLALGIGANTAIFSLMNSLRLQSLPVRSPHELAQLVMGSENWSFTNPLWEQVRDRAAANTAGAFAFSNTRFNMATGGQTEFVDGLWASGDLFDVLGVPATIGRTLTPKDDVRGATGADGPVAVISYRWWQQRYNGAMDVLGKTITLERVSFSIVGVAPPDFHGPEVGRTFDVVVPLGAEPLIRGRDSSLDRRSHWWLAVITRLKPDQTVEQAAAAWNGARPQIRVATMPQDWGPQGQRDYLKEDFTLRPAGAGTSALRTRYTRPLGALMVVVALVLLIACANVANLLLARATARRREMSIRLALGASRSLLARQLLAESLLLSGVGAVAGLLLARWGSQLLLQQFSTPTTNVVLNLAPDWRVLGFTMLVAVTTAVIFGTAPALRATRVQPNEALKAEGRGVVGDRRMGMTQALVVVQVALSLLLVVAAGLFVRTFASLVNRDPGFDRRPVLIAAVNASRSGVEPGDRPALYERIRQAVVAVPGVESVAASAVTPISGSTWQFGAHVPQARTLPERDRTVYVNAVTPDWFRTYGTRLLTGRDFTTADTATSPKVAIVNEAFVRKFIGEVPPLGLRIEDRNSKEETIHAGDVIGVVQDAVYRSLRDAPPPTMYLPLTQRPQDPFTSIGFSIRAQGEPALLIRSVSAAMTAVDRDLALTFRPLAVQVNAALIQERLMAILSGFFGGLALILAGLGLYGVTSYAVGRRRTEMGIRLALGAQPRGVLRLVLGRVALLVALGIVIGVGVSLWASQYVTSLLYGLPPRDPQTLGLAAAVLLVIGTLAGLMPALRASRLDPARVLREG